MSDDPTYTFEWRIDGVRRKTSVVPRSELWQRFNQAADWARRDDRRSVSYYGPGIMRVIVGEYARDRLREILEPLGLVPEEPHYIALLWADLGRGYEMFKVRKETEPLEGFERPHTVIHSLDPVDADDVRGAFSWAREQAWQDRGVWVNDKPALLFSAFWQRAADALQDIPQVAPLLYRGKAILASCAYDWRGQESDYPYIKPTRSRRKIQTYRGRWPTADDVKWPPLEVLIQKYGYGASGTLAAALVPV